MTRRFQLAVLAAAMASAFAGCSRIDFPSSAQANPTTAAVETPAVPTQAANTTGQATPVPMRAVPDFSQLVEREGPAVVNITVKRGGAADDGDDEAPSAHAPQMPQMPFPFNGPAPFGQGPQQQMPRVAQGSGFIIKADGYILTNAHVVGDGGDITVKLTDKRELKAKLIGADRRTDVALIKVDAKDLPVLAIGDPAKTKVGEWVAAIGAPFGFENSISAGIVSAKGRALPDETYVSFIQTDVAVNPGNSGGPLFNLNGEVIGINSQIYSRTGGYMGVSFAIPIDIAMDVANQLQTSGKVTRGRIGVQIQELSQELAKSFGLKDANGALVSSVESNGPADKAGVKSGDVIVEFNGKPVKDSRDLPLIVAQSKPGSDATLKVWRDGAEKSLHVTVTDLKPEKVAAAEKSVDKSKLGLAVQELTPQQKQQLEVAGGVLVEGAQGPAARAGIQQGDVVLAVNGENIQTIDQFKKIVDKAPKGRPLALLIQRGEARIYVPVMIG